MVSVPEAQRAEWRQAIEAVLRDDLTRADVVSHFAVAADVIRSGLVTPAAYRDWSGRVIILSATDDPTQSAKDLPRYEQLFGRTVQFVQLDDMGHTALLFDPAKYVDIVEQALARTQGDLPLDTGQRAAEAVALPRCESARGVLRWSCLRGMSLIGPEGGGSGYTAHPSDGGAGPWRGAAIRAPAGHSGVVAPHGGSLVPVAGDSTDLSALGRQLETHGGASGAGRDRWPRPGSLARRSASGATCGTRRVVTWGVTQGDTYLHLGMNARTRAAPPWDTLGLPVTLTLLRRTIAGYLWAHLLGGRPVRDRVILGTLLGLGAASDVLDGAVARRRRRVTRLGAYLDAEADGSFWLALGLTFAAQRILPRWFFALLCARFGVPVLAAALSHAVLHRSPPVGSTVIGKAAAVAQLAVFSAALVSSRRPAPGLAVQRAYRLLQGITAALLLAAPCAQVVRLFASPPADTPEAAATWKACR